MPPRTHYKLKIKRLDFISAVKAGAQGPISDAALIKRAPTGDEIEATCKVIKLDPKLGLVFGWAMAGTLDGGKTSHVDLQNDAIDVRSDDFIKACAEFMESGAASDVDHSENQDGRIVFAMPLVKEVNDALGIKSDVEGLAIAMKPSPEVFKRFLSGELAAFSIGGTGEREPVEKAADSFESICKSAVAECDGALEEFNKAQATFEKANNIAPGRGINKFIEQDPSARDLYRKHAEAFAQVQALYRHSRRGGRVV